MRKVPLKWGRVTIELSSPAECDELIARAEAAKEVLLSNQQGLLPPFVDQMGYISRQAFYAFFEQEGVKTDKRSQGPRLFGMLATAACQNQLPAGLMYCTECRKGVTGHCQKSDRYVDHSQYYQLNAGILKVKWRDLGKLRGIRPGDGSPLAIMVQQLKEHGK